MRVIISDLVAEVSGSLYWRHNFNSICNPKQLTEYIVMDIEPIKDKDKKFFPGQGAISYKVSFRFVQKKKNTNYMIIYITCGGFNMSRSYAN